jgi:hypothetical protein
MAMQRCALMVTHRLLTPVMICTALALSGCGVAGLRIISSDVDAGDFGAATMNNSLVMTGQRDATAALQSRFAGEVESTITFDFNSAVLTPQARTVLDRPILSDQTPITNRWANAGQRRSWPISAALVSAATGSRR